MLTVRKALYRVMGGSSWTTHCALGSMRTHLERPTLATPNGHGLAVLLKRTSLLCKLGGDLCTRCDCVVRASALAGKSPLSHLHQDLYFFGHGLDFPAALRDYVSLAGPIPLLPRYALGPGFSRWYAWNEHEEMQHIIADGFASHGVPLDQLSIDMDWVRGNVTSLLPFA